MVAGGGRAEGEAEGEEFCGHEGEGEGGGAGGVEEEGEGAEVEREEEVVEEGSFGFAATGKRGQHIC